jgi:hypothetical protein
MDFEPILEKLASNDLNPRLFAHDSDSFIQCRPVRKTDQSADEHVEWSFMNIHREEGGWRASIPGVPLDTVIAESISLTDVVNEVCEFYALRELTNPDGMTIEDASRLLHEANLIVRAQYEDTIWGNTQTPNGSLQETFGIWLHVGAWIAIHIQKESGHRVVKYSRALSDVVRAILEYFSEVP